MSSPRPTLLWLLVAAMLLAVEAAQAHEARPLFVQISEQQTQVYTVQIVVPGSVQASNVPLLTMPSVCEPLSAGPASQSVSSYLQQQTYLCHEALPGKELHVRYPVLNPSLTSLLTLELLSGQTYSGVFGPDELSWPIPGAETFTGVSLEYAQLGIGHILSGYDHLLFLACLALIAGTLRRIIIVVTGFTLAHSLTLAATALGYVSPPVVFVEIMIAVSIVFLAAEIAREQTHTLTWRNPIVVSILFGLLHGFGFAGGLQEIGLPQVHLLPALLFFNLGVEVGQLAVIAVGTLLWYGARQAGASLQRFRPAMAYAAGVFATCWVIERVYGVL